MRRLSKDKTCIPMKSFLLKIVCVPIVLSAACQSTPPAATIPPPPEVQKAVSDDALLRQATDTVLQDLKKSDFNLLSQWVHPVKGIVFSPYGYVDSATAVRMMPEQVREKFTVGDASKMLWGAYDGSGDSILLTPIAYYKRFIYDHDFAISDSMYFRKTPQRGNTLNNLRDLFPDGVVAERFVAGKTEMDWKALRMVFEKHNGRYLLVALVHDEWTI